MDTKEDAKRRTRRRHDDELKRQVLAQCATPGASVAKIAMDHGLNANLVHKWRRTAERHSDAVSSFVPVALPATAAAQAPHIELELQRGALSARVRWPMTEANACAAWLREILR